MADTSYHEHMIVQSVRRRRSLSNYAWRALSGMVGLVITLLITYLGGWFTTLLLIPVAIVGMMEFYAFRDRGRVRVSTLMAGLAAGLVVLSAQLGQILLWQLALLLAAVAIFIWEMRSPRNDLRLTLLRILTLVGGILYVAFPLALLVHLRALPNGLGWLLLVFAITWGTDTLAYMGGRLYGKHKLAPALSPGKTVEGALAGIVGGIGWAIGISIGYSLLSWPLLVLILIGPFVSIAGDLFESAVKRFYAVKDSHLAKFNVIPGHGGLLDRIDALLFVSVLSYGYVLLIGIAR